MRAIIFYGKKSLFYCIIIHDKYIGYDCVTFNNGILSFYC